MIENNLVHEISFMDHTPGQGQYKDLAVYEEAVVKYNGKEIQEKGIEEIIRYHQHKDRLSLEQLKELSELAHAHHITVASHDDDTKEKLLLNQQIGVDISEFPVNEEAAQFARSLGYYTVVGAPTSCWEAPIPEICRQLRPCWTAAGHHLLRLFPPGYSPRGVYDEQPLPYGSAAGSAEGDPESGESHED